MKPTHWVTKRTVFSVALQLLLRQDILIIEALRSYSDTPLCGGLLCTVDQPVAETSIWQHNIQKRQTTFLILVNNQLDAQFFFCLCYFNSLHVSSSHVLIIRRVNCINAISGICPLCGWTSGMQVWMELQFHPNFIQEGHLHRVTYTRYRIDTVDSPDDEHMAARNM